MRNIIALMVVLSMSKSLCAQSVVTIPVSLNDTWSNNSYKHITKNNEQILAHQTKQAAVIATTKAVMKAQNRELYTINPYLRSQKNLIKKYIELECKKYIRFRYPAVSKISGIPASVETKNLIIRNRFMKKFNKEKDMIDNYLEPKNFMSEGKRLYLTLNLLENLIDITLENETY